MKLLILIVGLAIGFGGGVYWGVHHPTQAAQLSDTEEKKFLELQIKTTEAIKQKLDQVAAKQQSQSSGGFGSGFVSNSSSRGPDPDIATLRDQQDRQLQDLRQHLQLLNGK